MDFKERVWLVQDGCEVWSIDFKSVKCGVESEEYIAKCASGECKVWSVKVEGVECGVSKIGYTMWRKMLEVQKV